MKPSAWWIKKLETDAESRPLRVYHRNGGPRAENVTKAWTHEPDAPCHLCVRGGARGARIA